MLRGNALVGQMPSRFVELATPIEDSVAWAESLGISFSTFLSESMNTFPLANLTHFGNVLNLTIDADFQRLRLASDLVQQIPIPTPKGVAAYILSVALAVTIARCILIRNTTHKILKTYGQSQVES